MGNCLRMRQLAGGALPGLQPLLHRAIIRPRGLQVVCEQFWLPLGKVGEVAFQHLGDARVQLLAAGAQQRAVGGVLHQRVLEQVRRLRRHAATEQQPGIGQQPEPGAQLRLRPLRHRLDQFVAEFSTEHRTDLRDFPRRAADPVEPGSQRRVQGRRNRQRGYRGCRQHRRQAVFLTDVFQHCLGQLLDEQRHAVGALDDLVGDLLGQRLAAGDLGDHLRTLCGSEPGEPDQTDVRAAGPWRRNRRLRGRSVSRR